MSDRVLIIGSAAPASLESSYFRAFSELAWTVSIWNPADALRRAAQGKEIGRRLASFITIEPWLKKANAELIQRVREVQPRLVIVITTGGVRAGTLAQLKVLFPELPIYCIYPDSPHYLDSERVNCLPFFDRIAVSSPAWINAFEKLGGQRVEYLPFAADPHLHRPQSLNSSSTHDVMFIGNWRPEREELLEQLIDHDLFIWGTDYWKTRTKPGSVLRSRWGGRTVIGEDFARECAKGKILLNIMDAITWPGPNMRVFEQPACRAFSLVTRSAAVLDIFKEGENIECFDSADEARDKVRFYLDNTDARHRVADAAHEFVVNHGHTYVDRARRLLGWLSENSQASVFQGSQLTTSAR